MQAPAIGTRGPIIVARRQPSSIVERFSGIYASMIASLRLLCRNGIRYYAYGRIVWLGNAPTDILGWIDVFKKVISHLCFGCRQSGEQFVITTQTATLTCLGLCARS